jgi:hypothetical protein
MSKEHVILRKSLIVGMKNYQKLKENPMKDLG